LQLGQRISAPFNTVMVSSHPEEPFKGEIYPTFFKTKNVEYGNVFKRIAPINQRMKFTFETDARDDYFRRRIERGNFSLVFVDKKGNEQDCSFIGPNLKSGIATVMANLPDDAEIGDVIKLIARTDDPHSAFENVIEATVKPATETQPGGGGTRKPPQNKPGNDREAPRQLSTPAIKRVFREEWESQTPPFNEWTAMRVEVAGYDADENEIYEFKINMDNTPLLSEIKQRRLEDMTARNQFLYANVLVGLSLLLQDKQSPKSNNEIVPSIEARIEETTRAMAPFILALTGLGQQDLSEADEIDGLEAATG
jgi:hypothetical protein